VVYRAAYYKRQALSFHKDHIELKKGLFFRDHFRAAYLNIKKIQVLRYPGSDTGSLTFFVAGEKRLSEEEQKAQAAAGGLVGVVALAAAKNATAQQYSFTAHHIEGIDDKLAQLDAILQGIATPAILEAAAAQPAAAVEIREGGQSLGNSLFKLIAISTVTVVGIPLLLFTFPWTVVAVRRRRYRVDDYRVVVSWGVIYPTQESILFDRIDSLSHDERFLNKMFKNGNVTLLTAGSSSPDLILKNMPEHNDFYSDIRERYSS
jgi:membrane protein YdbS with pleckstrin-like domain